jgi:hypothetical protein
LAVISVMVSPVLHFCDFVLSDRSERLSAVGTRGVPRARWQNHAARVKYDFLAADWVS